MPLQQNGYSLFWAPPSSLNLNIALLPYKLTMSNILQLMRSLDRHAPTEEQLFLKMILEQLDYLFAAVSHPPHDIRQASVEPARMDLEEGREQSDQHQSNSDEAQQSPQQSEASSVPSIEEISNFEESASEKTARRHVRKLGRIKKREKSRIYRNTKKPVSSFVFFYKDRLQQIKRTRHDESVGNIAKLLSKEWRMLTSREKRPYVRKAKRSLDAYYSEKKRIDDHFKGLNTVGKLKMMNASTSGPIDEDSHHSELGDDSVHKALTSFFIYFKQNADRISRESGEKQRGRLAKIASEEWKRLSSADKKKYEDLSLQSRQKYEERLMQKATKGSSHKSRPKKVKSHVASEEEQYKPRIYRNSSKKNCSGPANDCSNLESLNSQQGDSYQAKKDRKALRSQNSDIFFELIRDGVSKEQELSEERPAKDEQAEEDLNHYTIIQSNSSQPVEGQGLMELDCEARLLQGRRGEAKKLKGPLSAFLLYYQLNMRQLMEENANTRGSELVKIASSQWSELPEPQKYFYQQQARVSRQLFQLQKQAEGGRQERVVTRTARREAKSEQ